MVACLGGPFQFFQNGCKHRQWFGDASAPSHVVCAPPPCVPPSPPLHATGDIEGFDPQLLLWSSYDTIADCVDAQQQQQQASSAMQVDGTAGQQTATAAEGGQAGVQEFLLGELCGRLCVSTKEEVRCAGVVVLVCLLQLCSGSGLVRGQLPRLQSTFTGLLGDSNDLTQVCFFF